MSAQRLPEYLSVEEAIADAHRLHHWQSFTNACSCGNTDVPYWQHEQKMIAQIAEETALRLFLEADFRPFLVTAIRLYQKGNQP